MQAIMEHTEWKILTYEDLQVCFNRLKGTKKITIREFLEKTRIPLSAKEKEQKKQKRLFD